ncbi:MAG: ABC transporter permease [Fimbriimonadia bacterium]|nr:ABC transporter permease [Fimbriimonadia bacterium]
MKKNLGVLGLLLLVVVVTSLLDSKFLQSPNPSNIARWTGMFGILSVGQSFVIMTGGIDLSVGSVVGLTGCLLPMFTREMGIPVGIALLLIAGICAALGAFHGILITKLRLQPFVVTLCGLFIYRGVSRYLTGDMTQGFGDGFRELRLLANGTTWGLPNPFLIMILVLIASSLALNFTVYGRHVLAVGRSEQAARYSGIAADRTLIMTYMLSTLMAGLAGVLFALDLNSIQPSGHGNFFELYAIAGAVLGGCSLRGGVGSVMGAIIGTALVRVLYNAINILGIPTQLEFAFVGGVILVGVAGEEILKRLAGRFKKPAAS